jgi:hypothetical protein
VRDQYTAFTKKYADVPRNKILAGLAKQYAALTDAQKQVREATQGHVTMINH